MGDFSTRLKALRLREHMTQAELADKLSVTKSVISAYENKIRMPSYDILIHISKILDVSTDYLLCNERQYNVDLSGISPEVKDAILALLETIKNQT